MEIYVVTLNDLIAVHQVPRPPCLQDNTRSVVVTIALLSESEVAEAST